MVSDEDKGRQTEQQNSAPQNQPAERRDKLSSLLEDEVPSRADRAGELLRQHIQGKVLLKLYDVNKNYVYDWSETALKVQTATNASAECTIEMSSKNVLRVADGDLNPQVGMLTEKIRISGKTETAIYFFNLLAPRSNN